MTTQLSEEQVKEILNGAMDQIKAGVINEAMKDIIWKTQNVMNSEIEKIVVEFVKTEIAPELLVGLKANKSAIIESGVVAANSIAEQLAASLAAKLAENLGSSYKRSSIFKALFE